MKPLFIFSVCMICATVDGDVPYKNKTGVLLFDCELLNVDSAFVTQTEEVADILCKDGFDIEGNSKVYCDNGQWNNLPHCVRRCSPPPRVKNGILEIKEANYGMGQERMYYSKGALAIYSCNKGYTLSPIESKFRVCEEGIWTGHYASCVPSVEITSCSNPNEIANGYYVNERHNLVDEFNIGQRIHYSCKAGYILDGTPVQLCLDSGQWSPKIQPNCISVMIDNPVDLLCRGYPFVPHSSTIVVQGSTEDAASPGTVIEIKCLTKFRNLNQDSKQPYQPSKLTCSEGHWVGIPPICVPADECSQPPKVAYSTMTSPEAYHSKLPNKFPVKSQVLYQCVPGYILEGSEILSCLVGGFWLPSEPPTCLRTGTSYYFEVNGIDAVLVTTATGAGVLSLLLIICLVVVCKRKKHIARAVTIPTPVQRQDMGDHAVLLHQPDRLALIAFADGIHNGQSPLPTYDEATRDRGPSLTVNRLQRPHWPSMAIRRARNSPNPDMVHVTRHGSFASHTPSTRSAGDSMGSTDTMAVSEGSTNVTLDTASSYSGSQAASCRAHCGSLASFDTCSVINTEGVPLLEESELEEIQACDTISLVLENPSLSDNASHKLSTTSADFP